MKKIFTILLLFSTVAAIAQDTTYMKLYFSEDLAKFKKSDFGDLPYEKQRLSVVSSINYNFLKDKNTVLSLGFSFLYLDYLRNDNIDFVNMVVNQTRFIDRYPGINAEMRHEAKFYKSYGLSLSIRVIGTMLDYVPDDDYYHRLQVMPTFKVGFSYYFKDLELIGQYEIGSYYVVSNLNHRNAQGLSFTVGWHW